MEEVLDSVKQVAEIAKHVSIDTQALEEFADSIEPSELADAAPFYEPLDGLSLEQHIALGLIFQSVNFSHWGSPKWAIDVDGHSLDGSSAMLAALQRGIKSGYNLLSAEYLRVMPEADFAQVLRGNIQIPLFDERLQLLRTLGEHIHDNYTGSFAALVDKSNWDAVKLVNILVDELPTIFRDEVGYAGLTVKFYKRAQLVPSHLHELQRLGIVSRTVTNMDQLTALADYKIPQILRQHGVLRYTPELAAHVDSQVELTPGSNEEVEIRAVSVWAVQLLVEALAKRGINSTTIHVDHVLWLRSRSKSASDKPYHHTRTTWY